MRAKTTSSLAMTTYYTSTTAKVHYDSAVDTLFLEYLGPVKNDAQFIEINTAVLDAFKKLKTQKFVADVRKMGIISLASQQWVVNTLLPGMIKHLNGKKLYHAQFLDPQEILAKVSASNIKKKQTEVAKDFEVAQFSDELTLRQYLANVPTSN
jgi:hypothetical protein